MASVDKTKEFEVYIPLHDNDGAAIEKSKIEALKKKLIREFGGLTLFPQKNEGIWKVGRFTFRDKIIIARVLASDSRRAETFFRKLRQEMKKEFGQSEVLIVEREVRVV